MRLKIFLREPLMWFLTILPIIQCLMSLIKYSGSITQIEYLFLASAGYTGLALTSLSGVLVQPLSTLRHSNIRYLLNMSGLKANAYWMGNIIFDYV